MRGRYVEAADVHVLNGRLIEAIQCCLKNQEDETTFRHAVDIILDALWKKYSFAVSACKALKKGTTAAHILELALNLSQEYLSASDKDQVRWPHCNLCVWQSILLERFRSTSFGRCNKPLTMRFTSLACPLLAEMITLSHWSLSTLCFRNFPVYVPRASLT